jgi:alpha-glucosidase (family GH31 glycosyl hydrolase)
MAIMDISLIQVGLSIITAFFVLSGYMIIYENPQQIRADMKNIAHRVSSIIQEVDGYWLEQVNIHQLPQSTQRALITLSPDFISVGSDESSVTVTSPVFPRIWIVDENHSLQNATCFHTHIYNETDHYGSRNDPCTNSSLVLDIFKDLWLQQKKFHLHPLMFTNKDMLRFEKCIFFNKININGREEIVPFYEFVIIQKN